MGTKFSSVTNVGYVPVGKIMPSILSTIEGWISCVGNSIGKTGATYNGNLYRKLYDYLWALDGLSTIAGEPFVISSVKGVSASVDWEANKIITIDFRTYGFPRQLPAAGRNLGDKQDNDNKTHDHTVVVSYEAGAVTSYAHMNYIGTRGRQDTANDPPTGVRYYGMSNSGLAEARPNNVSVNYFIKY